MSNPPPSLSTSLPRPLSLYLDGCRFLAALLVVASHFGQYGLVDDAPGRWWLHLGHESVVLFFVLSGFVIAFTTEQKRQDARAYCLARCTRIYSVALPLVLLGFALAGALVLSGHARAEEFYQLAKPWLYLPLHLLFMGEFWAVSEPPPMLAPYWSLGYEVWYYVLFGVAFYLRGPRRVLVVLALLLLVGPKLWLLLPVWLAGVAAYRWQARQQLAHHWALAGWCATLLLLAAFKAAELDVSLRALAHAWWPFPALPLKSADRFLADYLVCVLVACNFVCARRLGFRALLRVEKPLRALASYTFTLYLVHALVMQAWLHLVPTLPASSASLVLLAALIGACTWLVGQVTEQRKHWFAALFLRLVPGMRLAPR